MVTSSESEPGPTVYSKMDAVFAARTASRCCAPLLPLLKPSFHILDVGCGPGSITLDLARLVPEGRVVGVDISVHAIASARSAAKAQGVENAEFAQGDATKLGESEALANRKDGDDASALFDVVHAHMLLMHLPDPVHAIREMRKFVKPNGGVLSFTDAAAVKIYPELPVLMKHIDTFERLLESRGGDNHAGMRSHVWANQAGFRWDQIQRFSNSWGYFTKTERKLWSEATKESARTLMVQAGYATEEEMDEAKNTWETWAELDEAKFIGLDGQILCFN